MGWACTGQGLHCVQSGGSPLQGLNWTGLDAESTVERTTTEQNLKIAGKRGIHFRNRSRTYTAQGQRWSHWAEGDGARCMGSLKINSEAQLSLKTNARTHEVFRV